MRVTDFCSDAGETNPDNLCARVISDNGNRILNLCVRKLDNGQWNAIVRDNLGDFVSRGRDCESCREAIEESRQLAVLHLRRAADILSNQNLY